MYIKLKKSSISEFNIQICKALQSVLEAIVPQGVVLSPLLWCLIVNYLIRTLTSNEYEVTTR